ncbi:MAG TPA: hypothetical protein VM638_07655, partial [Actinomycetota bacterium]|nr:hypothetical protein [Actinomycetota bacterium]
SVVMRARTLVAVVLFLPLVPAAPLRAAATTGGAGTPEVLISGLGDARALAVRPDGDLFVADRSRILRRAGDGRTEVVAGSTQPGDNDGHGSEARFRMITGLAFDDAGNLWIADHGAGRVKVLDPTGDVATVAGSGVTNNPNGPGGPARLEPLFEPSDLVPMPDGSVIFTQGGADYIWPGRHGSQATAVAPIGRLRAIRDGDVVNLNREAYPPYMLPNDGRLQDANFSFPRGIARGPDGAVYIAEWASNRIRRVEGNTVETVYGDGGRGNRGDGSLAVLASIHHPLDLAFGPEGHLFITQGHSPERPGGGTGQGGDDPQVRMVSPSGMIQRITSPSAPIYQPLSVDVMPDGSVVFVNRRCVNWCGGGEDVAVAQVLRIPKPEGGWPNPAPNVVCDPYIADGTGDARQRLVSSNRGVNRPWLDIVGAEIRTLGDRLEAQIRVEDLGEAWRGTYAGLGTTNAWFVILRVGDDRYRYLLASTPANLESADATALVHFEYGSAGGVQEALRWDWWYNETWYTDRAGSATGTLDPATDTITISAPLAGLGLKLGDTITYTEAMGGSLFEWRLGRRSAWGDDKAPAPADFESTGTGGTFRSIRVGRNCPEGYLGA